MRAMRKLVGGLLAIVGVAAAGAEPARLGEAVTDASAAQRFFKKHTEQVRASVEAALRVVELSSHQHMLASAGLEAFLEARRAGDPTRESRPDVLAEAGSLSGDGFDPASLAGPEALAGGNQLTEELVAGGAFVCLPGDELLLNGRFLVTALVQDLNGFVFRGLGCRLTAASGYFYFFDRGNVEVPMKMLNGCFGGSPASHWVFAAGLTNFGVEISIFDLFTGVRKSYLNPTGNFFSLIIDQQTPFPCP